ncbi:MAG: fibronectin type III domain-containing protein [Micromonospora sp.]
MTGSADRGRLTRARRHSRWLLLAVPAAVLLAVGVAVVPDRPADDRGSSAARLTVLFDQYGDTSARWNGADRTASVALPDGRTLWLFSDTFLGPVQPDGSRPRTAPFINNSAVVQQGDELRETVHGGSAADPTSLVPPPAADQFYWIGDAKVTGQSLQVLVNRYRRTGSGPLDHALLGTALATFALPALTPTGLRPLPLGPGISWGSELLRDGDHTYVYGTETVGQSRFAHVARVAGDDLAGPWEFWTGSDWSPSEEASTRLLSGVGTAYGVQRVAGRYVLVTQESNVVFSPDLVAYTADSPTGPFEGPDYLYRAPENAEGHIIYDADLHPDLARPGRLLISYNVNDLDDAVTYADAGVYRPRFVEVAWPRRRPDPADLPPPPADLTAVADGAGHARLTWRAPRADDELRYQVHRRDVTGGQTHFVRLGEPVSGTGLSADFLVNGHDYEFRVTTVGGRGESGPSAVATMTARVPPPPPPVGVRAVAGAAGDVALHWDPVPFVQLFRVQQRNVTTGQRTWTLAGTHTGTSATVESLRHAETYEFSVIAVGGGGDSRPSAPVRATAFVTPPPPPTGLTATPSPNGTIALTWNTLGPGVSYRVYRRDVTAGETRLAPPSLDTRAAHTAGQLTHDHEYEFVVAAVNSGGVGPKSAPVRARARYTPPGTAPTRLRAEPGPGPGSVELTWRSPKPDGWHRVYRRDLTAQEREFTAEEIPVQGEGATINGLRNGHEYEFAVAVVNQAGAGPLSEPVRVTPDLPVPAGLTATASGNGEVRLSWRSAGPGLFYRVYLRDATAGQAWRPDQYPVPDTSHTAVLLTRGHRYEFRVVTADGTDESRPTDPVAVDVR